VPRKEGGEGGEERERGGRERKEGERGERGPILRHIVMRVLQYRSLSGARLFLKLNKMKLNQCNRILIIVVQ